MEASEQVNQPFQGDFSAYMVRALDESLIKKSK